MQESQLLTDTLKRCLRASSLTYRDVATVLDLSEASVKRVFSEGTFTLQRLERICTMMDMRIGDLCRLADKLHSERSTTLSLEQETALVESAELLRYFYRLLSGWEVAAINRAHALSEHLATRLLARLDRLGMIDLQPGNTVRMRVGPHIAWRTDGPLWQRYADAVQADFMTPGGFRGEGAAFHFKTGELSAGSLDILSRKMSGLAREFLELVELDSTLQPDQRQHTGLMVGLKPWLFSPLFTAEEATDHAFEGS